MFALGELRQWAARELLNRCEGRKLPVELRPVVELEKAEVRPDELRYIDALRELPLHQIAPGVYFLVLAGRVVYVGQSVNIPGRIANHRRDKQFDRIFVLHVPEEALDEVEGAFIRLLDPPLNSNQGTPVEVGAGDEKVLEIYQGGSPWDRR